MTGRMSKREKVLSTLVGGTVAILLNLFLISFFVKNHARLRGERTQKQEQLAAMQTLMLDRPLWEEREAWLLAKQPRIENEATAGGKLLDQVQELARQHAIVLEVPAIGTPERRPQMVSVPVTLETKSTWKALVGFLRELQGPEQFIVIESGNLRIDPQDQTQMRGKFRVAKWYAAK